MSKREVRKAIAALDSEGLRELLMQLYDKSKDSKAMLDFWANPDIEAKLDEHKALVDAELARRHRRVPAPRMSRVKAAVKRLAAFEVGDEAVAELMLYACQGMAATDSVWLPESLHLSMGRFFAGFLEYAHRRGLLDDFMPRVLKMAQPPAGHYDDRVAVTFHRVLDDFNNGLEAAPEKR